MIAAVENNTGPINEADEEVLPLLREDGAATGTQPSDTGHHGTALLAYILASKFDDRLPLYGLNDIFARVGADIPDSTLVEWCGRAMRVTDTVHEHYDTTAPPNSRQQFSVAVETTSYAWREIRLTLANSTLWICLPGTR